MILLSLLLTLAPAHQEPLSFREVLAVESLGVRARSALNTDALEHSLALGFDVSPSEGDRVMATSGKERTWKRVEANESGSFEGSAFRGGWAFAELEVPTTGPWCLQLRGASSVAVDGAFHNGDVYGLGITRIPLHLEAGEHEFLFRTGRGQMTATLEPAPAELFFESLDRTLPDVMRGEAERLWMGQLISNAGPLPVSGLTVRCTSSLDEKATLQPLPTLLPSSQHKCAIALEPGEDSNLDELEKVEVLLELLNPAGEVLGETQFELSVRDASDKHVRTFRSRIDDSVQYYGVTPPAADLGLDGQDVPALVLTLHGASVEGGHQARCYQHKDWGFVVAPTNRRPFGFDWEDWGRMDALEVLELTSERFGADPRRTYLTGHSMGGHGTWQLGAHFPERFAAIAPSAGWRDFWSYGGAVEVDLEDPVAAMMIRSTNASRTLLLQENYLQNGIYVLHGDADRTVPVSEARAMRTHLAESHPNFAYYERAGAGHWWGNECMDWPPLMRFLQDNVRPEPAQIRDVQFTTINPGLSSRHDWVTARTQEHSLEPSRIEASIDTEAGTMRVKTQNLLSVSLDLRQFANLEPSLTRLECDGTELALTDASLEQPVHLVRTPDAGWSLASAREGLRKTPLRAGPFKDAFRNRMMFVYGTGGTEEENAWALAKVRYDLEAWRYRGNGSVEVMTDVEFLARFGSGEEADRGVILYGNQDTNGAWDSVVEGSELELRREFVRVGEKKLEGAGLALLAVRPRKGSDRACVAIVGGTGLTGCRTTDHRSYFVSGVGYPDWTLLDVESLRVGVEGVLGAGFFGADWSVASGDSAWR